MLEFYKQKRWWMVLYSPVMLILLLLLVITLGRAVYERYTIEREMAVRRFEVEKQIEQLKMRRDILKDKVEYLSNERGIEAEMRRNFDVAQEGEKVVVILDDETSPVITLPTAPPVPPSAPWYRFWE